MKWHAPAVRLLPEKGREITKCWSVAGGRISYSDTHSFITERAWYSGERVGIYIHRSRYQFPSHVLSFVQPSPSPTCTRDPRDAPTKPKPIRKENEQPKTNMKRATATQNWYKKRCWPELLIRKAPLVVCKITFMTRGKVVRGIQDSFASFRRIVHHLRPPFIGFPIWIWIS